MKDPLGLIDTELGKVRLEICKGCEERSIYSGVAFPGKPYEIHLFEAPVCGTIGESVEGKSCGCLLNIKANLKPFKCPQKKWPKKLKPGLMT